MYFDPFEEFSRMAQEMNQVMSRTWPQVGMEGGKKEVALYRKPVCDVAETEKNVIATFEIPGAEKDEIEVNIQDNVLEIKVERKKEKEVMDEESATYLYHRTFGQYFRKVPLPAEVDEEKAEASYKDGVLKIEIPKVQKHLKSKKIAVQ